MALWWNLPSCVTLSRISQQPKNKSESGWVGSHCKGWLWQEKDKNKCVQSNSNITAIEVRSRMWAKIIEGISLLALPELSDIVLYLHAPVVRPSFCTVILFPDYLRIHRHTYIHVSTHTAHTGYKKQTATILDIMLMELTTQPDLPIYVSVLSISFKHFPNSLSVLECLINLPLILLPFTFSLSLYKEMHFLVSGYKMFWLLSLSKRNK